jgi:hypothetical protein
VGGEGVGGDLGRLEGAADVGAVVKDPQPADVAGPVVARAGEVAGFERGVGHPDVAPETDRFAVAEHPPAGRLGELGAFRLGRHDRANHLLLGQGRGAG